MVTNKKSVKIQDVIDEVNSVWGEAHEEKRKRIFLDNILKLPLYAFFIFSLFYFSAIIIAFPFLISLSGDEDGSHIWLVSEIFNIPYYLFDLRVGIISSIASLLLSLFVSVGKFADGEKGLIGEARRAAYRKFARMVGYIIFAAFVLSFWYGFLAGYLNGTSYAPEFIGTEGRGPGWGTLLVSRGMDLSRYGDIPLWVLVFFAWFTLSSALMLTYNEKDLLIQNAYIVQRVNHMNMSADFSVRDAYKLALQAIESERDIPSLSRFSNGKRREKYSDLFVEDGGYYGFKFVEISIWSRLWRWLLLFLGLSLHSSVLMLMARTFEGWPLVLLTLVILFVFEMYIYATNDPMYREIYKINLENVHGMDRVKEFFKSSVFAAFVEAARLVVLTVIVYVSFVEYQPSFIPIFMIIIIFYLGRIAVNSGIKILFESRLKEFSDEFLAVHISRNENVNYLIVAYIYCMMLKVNEFYLEYKSEILDSESSISMSVKYRKSRVAIRRTPKSILMHKDSRSQ